MAWTIQSVKRVLPQIVVDIRGDIEYGVVAEPDKEFATVQLAGGHSIEVEWGTVVDLLNHDRVLTIEAEGDEWECES